MVRLAAFEAEAECGRLCFEPRVNIVERVVAIDFGLARAEQVEVGAGEDEDGGKFSQGTAFRLRRCGLPLYGLLGKRQSEAAFPMISVILNGEPRQVREGSIAALVASLRSEEHTSELQLLLRNSYAFFCLKKTPTH